MTQIAAPNRALTATSSPAITAGNSKTVFGSDVNTLTAIARMMADSSFTPKHLVWSDDPNRTLANCFRVVNQAAMWGMDPFSVADETDRKSVV